MKTAATLLFCAALTLSAQVKIIDSALPLDGEFTENGWRDIPAQSDFTQPKASGKKLPAAQTSFKIAADKNNLYMKILCHEPKMDKLKRSPSANIWTTDSVEIFFCPTGHSDEYYQFAVTAGGSRYSMFYGEEGVITPDPYFPFWESKVSYGKDYWLVSLRIPFSAFYMTRNEKWNTQWRLNVARERSPIRESSSWSQLQNSFQESQNFRKVNGFPKRNPAQDILIHKAEPSITGFSNGVYSGPLELTIEANPAAAGKYELSVEEPDGQSSVHTIALKDGLNRIVLPKTTYRGKTKGKTNLKLTLKSLKSGVVTGRSYPVDIIYRPIRIAFRSPGYRRNFYPGQDHSRIAGSLHLNLSAAQRKSASVELTLSGDGLTTTTQKFQADAQDIPFSFDSSALTEGGKAVLTAAVLDGGSKIASVSKTVTRLRKNAGSMVWIENGAVIRNGKPIYPRYIDAPGYLGGRAFAERCKADDLGDTPFRQVSLEPFRLIRGIEEKEARRDVKPCPEIFAKIRERVEKNRNNPALIYYFITDEPECRNLSPVYLKYIYDFVRELDPYHPVATCSRAADRFIECADILETHPYINPIVSEGKRILSLPIHRVRNYLQDVTKFNRADKVVGFTGQFFSYKFNNILADYPTWEELECMSWSAIVQGSRFHYPYAYHDLGDRPQIYEGYRYFNQSIKALESLLLSNRKHPVKAVDPENMIDTLLVEDGDAALLIVVNLKNGPLDTVVSADHLKQFRSMLEFRGKGSRKIVNGELKLSLKPYECVVLTSKKLDAGLKPRDQVAEEIAKANRARAERGSLLFEKGASFEVDSSNPGHALSGPLQQRNKLFDGTIDMLGWESKRYAKENWYELNFRKNPPKFTRIGIYGHFGGTPQAKIWKFGEWKKLVPKDVKTGKYSAVLDFREELKSVKIRLDFELPPGEKTVELYEIELHK